MDKKIESAIKNILPDNDRSKLINCNGDDIFNKEKKEPELPTKKEQAISTKQKEDNFLDYLGLSRDDLSDDGSDLEELKDLGGFNE
tara:strand:+ start:140 stop:397 length:258 start_codon:yes stop_codon:yes gene_type:complete